MQLRTAEEACAALEACCLQETERRARALSTLSSPESCLLSQGEQQVLLVVLLVVPGKEHEKPLHHLNVLISH